MMLARSFMMHEPMYLWEVVVYAVLALAAIPWLWGLWKDHSTRRRREQENPVARVREEAPGSQQTLEKRQMWERLARAERERQARRDSDQKLQAWWDRREHEERPSRPERSSVDR